MIKWVLPTAGVKFLVKVFKKKDEIIAKFATLERVWTSYIPPREATFEDAPEDAEVAVPDVVEDAVEVAENAAEVAENAAEVADVPDVMVVAAAAAVAAAAKAAKAVLARAARKARLIDKAQSAFEKYQKDVDALVDSDWVDIMKWVLTAAKKKFRVMDLTTKDLIIAKFATLDTHWTSFIPHREATSEVAP